MNLVGKILTVLLFTMSMTFMATAVMTFAGSRNYKEAVAGGEGGTSLTSELQQLRQTLSKRETESQSLAMQIDHELGTRRAALAALETRSRELSTSLEKQQVSFATLMKQHEDNVKLIANSQKDISDVTGKVAAARAKLSEDFKSRDAMLIELSLIHI